MTIEATTANATDLGYVLAKNPARVQTFDVSCGRATVFYPIAEEQTCQVALLVDVDTASLAKSRSFRHDDFALGTYVNDWAYSASSLLSVAIGRVFSSALHGVCKERPELATMAWPLAVHLPSAPGTPQLAHDLFEPLGWQVDAATPAQPGPVDLRLTGQLTVQRALQHLYVLLPVLDDAKHYWVDETESDKLLRNSDEWLPTHPCRDLITARYLAHQRPYIADATARLLGAEGAADDLSAHSRQARDMPSLATQRYDAIAQQMTDLGVHTVADLGCGEGRLLLVLASNPGFTGIVGGDVSPTALARAEASLRRLPDRARERITLLQTSVTYRDTRLAGFDAIVLAEVVEHVDADRLDALAQVVFGDDAPGFVIVTTPNAEYNAVFPQLEAGALRHADHRFEWSRPEFQAWAGQIGDHFAYSAQFFDIGDAHETFGAPTQMAVFSKRQEVPND